MKTLKSAGIAALVAASACIAATPAAQAATINVGDGQCSSCMYGGVDHAGNIYLAEQGASRIRVFSPDGTLSRIITSGGGLNLTNLTDIEPLPDGNLVLGSYTGLSVMTPEGGLVANYGSIWTQDLAVDPAGNIYWTAGATIGMRDADTGAVTTIYTHPNNDSLDRVVYNPVDGRLYVLDHSDSTILRLTPGGVAMGSFGSFGYGPAELHSPRDIAVDSSGDLYVAQDATNPGINKFRRDGTPLGFYSLSNTAPYGVKWVNDSLIVPRWQGATKIDLDNPIAALTGPSTGPWTGVFAGQRATFSAAASLMPFGSITRYQWDLDGDGAFETDTGSTPTAVHVFPTDGGHIVRVRVTSSTGTTDTTQVSLAVGRTPAVLSTNQMALTGQPVTLNASGSTSGGPNANTVASVRFDLDGDGTFETDTGTNLQTTTTYNDVGTVNPGVQVTREGGVVDVARTAVTVYPAPPPGHVGVSINDGDKYTNDPHVELSLVWPDYAKTALVANDGGFRHARSFPVTSTITTTLDSSGPERLPKTVYVQFDNGNRTVTDDIILDETRPTVSTASVGVPATAQASAAAAHARSFRVVLKATDKTSGVESVQFARSKSKPSKPVNYARKVTVRATASPRYVRAQDRAGNFSAWKKLATRHK